MSEHLRALVVILVFSLCTFWLIKPALLPFVTSTDFVRRRNLWLTTTVTAFVLPSFWGVAAFTAAVLFWLRRTEHNPSALFMALLFAVPAVVIIVPGLGVVNYLFQLSFPRLLSLLILLPAAVALWQKSHEIRWQSAWPDRLFLTYLLLDVLLQSRGSTATDVIRFGFYALVDAWLPYYVVSRGLTKLALFKDTIASLVMAAALLAPVAVFEMSKHWLLYASLPARFGGASSAIYLLRDGVLRASATTGQAIVLGAVFLVALGLYFYLKPDITSRNRQRLAMLALLGGLVAPLSRGPWVGAVAAFVAFLATGKGATKKLLSLGLLGVCALPVLSLFPAGQKVINLLPFVGQVDASNIDYRQRLYDNSVILIQQNPWLGSIDYRDRLADMGMVQGQGIVDVVNTYLAVALSNGLLGLSLFVLFFTTVLHGVWQAMQQCRTMGLQPEDDLYRLGRALLATLLGLLLTIATVSSISFIPWLYWMLAGMCVAYVQLCNQHAKQKSIPAT